MIIPSDFIFVNSISRNMHKRFMDFFKAVVIMTVETKNKAAPLIGGGFSSNCTYFRNFCALDKIGKTRNSGCFTDLIRHMHPHYPFALMHRSAAVTKAAIASARDARVRLQASA